MANNCLQTKLKSFVNNDNLPMLNTLIFNIDGRNNNDPTMIFKASTPIHVSTKINMYVDRSYTNPKTEIDIQGTYPLHFKPSDCTEPIADCVKITGNIYNIVSLGANFNIYENTDKSGIKSLQYSAMVCYGDSTNYPGFTLPETIEYIQGPQYIQSLEYLFAEPYHVKYFKNSPVLLNEVTKANTSVISMNVVSGDIINLPRNIAMFGVNIDSHGSIDELVNRLRSEGRTNGSIYISNYSTNLDVTYNGNPLVQTIPANTSKVLVWTNDSISWQTEDTEETAPAHDSLYSYSLRLP